MNKRGAALGIVATLLVAGLMLQPAWGEGSTSPPKHLKKVGDHWTAWDPPPAAEGAYIIVRGDTLWDLAERFYQDPYLWPQIWDENRYIRDSHWIYPGDPLVIPGRPVVVPDEGPTPVIDVGQADTGDRTGIERQPPVERLEPQPLLPVADASDLYCISYIVPDHEGSGLTVAAAESEMTLMSEGDVVFLDHGRDRGLVPGDEFAVIRDTGPVDHPADGKVIGHAIRRMGRLRVMLVHETSSTAVIDFACEDIGVGDEVVPWEEIPAPLVRTLPPFDRYDPTESGRPTGYVVIIEDRLGAAGAGQLINVDLGVGSGVRPGDVLTLYRPLGADLPRINLGQAIVLTVEPDTATAKIVQSVRESYIGDRVEIAR